MKFKYKLLFNIRVKTIRIKWNVQIIRSEVNVFHNNEYLLFKESLYYLQYKNITGKNIWNKIDFLQVMKKPLRLYKSASVQFPLLLFGS